MKKNRKNVLAELGKYVREICRHDRKQLTWMTVLTVAIAGFEAVELWLMVPFMVLAGMSAGLDQTARPFLSDLAAHFNQKTGMLVILLIYVIVNIVQAVLQKKQSVSSMAFRAGFSRSLSNRLYSAFAEAKWQYIIGRRRSDVVNVLTNDLRNIDTGTYLVVQFLSALPIALAQLAVAFYLSPKVTALTIVLSAVFFVALRKNNNKLSDCAMTMHELMQNSIKLVSEHLAGIKEVKSYGAEKAQIQRFRQTNGAVEQKYLQFAEIFAKTSFFYKVGSVLVISLFFFIALVFLGMEIASIVIILVIFSRIWPFLSMVQTSTQLSIMMLPSWTNFQKWLADCSAAREEFTTDGESASVNELAVIPGKRLEISDNITLNNLSFSYADDKQSALSDVTIQLPRGTITAVTGTSGSGKSTLADLILGLLAPQSGSILVDGQPLSGAMLSDWRASIGYVPQETVLFNSTIRENLLWVKPEATEAELTEALQLAAADDFVGQLPDGLDTQLGERGIGLSGGEKQRIALARALLRQPTLLILDEATSSLDVKNEERIQKVIENMRGKMTVLVIAHRLSTIKNADQLIVLDNGKLVECGKYADLAADRNGKFYELATTLA
ncbi:MAG: ABC transporter ATP-binding protein [Bacillota bacterium]